MTDHATLSLARQLIERRSITPDDAGCLDLLQDRLAPQGFVCERFDRNGVANLWARRGREQPLMCFAGHTDVVPPGPPAEWQTDPFTATERDGLLIGRGAADMKSSLAAFVVAAERFAIAHPQHSGSLALLLTSDEEGDAVDGTALVVEELRSRQVAIDYCIVAEPTCTHALGDTIKNGRRGSLSGKLTVHGIQGHVAYPEKVRNPIHLVAPAIAELVATEWDRGNQYFPPTSFQVSNIHAGTGAGNVVPGTLALQFNFRFSTASSVDELQHRVHAVLDRHGLEYDLEWTIGGLPFLTGRGHLVEVLEQAIRDTTGREPQLSTSGGTSDGRFIATLCPQVVEFGPINASIHKVNEHVAIADLEPLTEIYYRTLTALLP